MNYIPKGSKLYDNDKFIAEIVNDLNRGDKISRYDLVPSIKSGTKIKNMIVKYNGKVIYKHPNFV